MNTWDFSGPKGPTAVSGGKDANRFLTHCKVCGNAVLRGQEFEWFRKPLGVSHTACMVVTDGDMDLRRTGD